MLKQILTKPLLAFALFIQCVFLVFTLVSAPEANGKMQVAISSLRTPSQTNIAPINQTDARELRLVLERLISNHKFLTMVSVLFSFLSIALMATVILPFGSRRSQGSADFDGRIKI